MRLSIRIAYALCILFMLQPLMNSNAMGTALLERTTCASGHDEFVGPSQSIPSVPSTPGFALGFFASNCGYVSHVDSEIPLNAHEAASMYEDLRADIFLTRASLGLVTLASTVAIPAQTPELAPAQTSETIPAALYEATHFGIIDAVRYGMAEPSPDTGMYLSSDEFLFAGHPRYTIDGSPPLRTSDIRPYTLAATGGMYAGIMIGLHVYQMQTFWQQRSPTFNLIEDGTYAKGVDKFGHFFGGHLMCYYSTEVLQASGLSVESAHVWGTLLGMVYQTYVEIEDGYGSNWGFSPSDMYANAAGATYYLAQYYVPFLQNFTPKWIYTPASWIRESARAEGLTFIDDYSSSTFYMSCKVFNLLPASAQQWWPRWLNVAVGYAARGLDTPNSDTKIILALDYDLPELLPDFRATVGGTLGDVLNWCKQTFNYLKLPSPALEFGASGVTRFNLMYPFKFRVAGIQF